MRRLRPFLLATALALGTFACGEAADTADGGSPCDAPEPALDGEAGLLACVFLPGCAIASCHGPATARLRPVIEAPAVDGEPSTVCEALVGVESRDAPGRVLVAPGDPAGSYLLDKLAGAAGIAGDRMPPGGGPGLSAGQLAAVRAWIAAGAPCEGP